MSQKNETVALVLSFLVTGGILGGGAWLLFNSGFNPGNNSSNTNNSNSNNNPSNSNPSNNTKSLPAAESISAGERVFIPSAAVEKSTAASAFTKGNYSGAVAGFSATLAKNKNDPEALIYLNNAKIGKNKSLTIAVSAPIGSDPNVAQEILRGVAQAQNQVNQSGGINGTPLKVVIADDQNKPDCKML